LRTRSEKKKSEKGMRLGGVSTEGKAVQQENYNEMSLQGGAGRGRDSLDSSHGTKGIDVPTIKKGP